MIRYLLIFIGTSLLIHFGIEVWRSLTKQERWSLTKSAGYGIIVSSVAVFLLFILVELF